MTALDLITKLLVDRGIPAAEVKPEAILEEDLGIDCLDRFDIISALEDELRVELSDSETEYLGKVQDLVALAEKYMGAGQ